MILFQKCQNRLEDQQLTSDDIPVIVDKCIKFIMTNGKSYLGKAENESLYFSLKFSMLFTSVRIVIDISITPLVVVTLIILGNRSLNMELHA